LLTRERLPSAARRLQARRDGSVAGCLQRLADLHFQPRMQIGIISDTHGLLRPEALTALRDSDYIIHAGDIGAPEILARLAAIAPLTPIRGNVDREPWSREIAAVNILEVGDLSIYVLHNLAELDLKPEAAGFAAVVSGHSHVPRMETKNGVLYFNPGSAGPRRFKLPVTVGRLTVEGPSVRGEIFEIVG